MSNLLDTKEIEIVDQRGETRKFYLSKFPAVQGREIMAKYPVSNMPKLGDYAVSQEVMLKLMKFVGVKTGDIVIPLSSQDLIDNHVRDWETLAKLELAMMGYNCSFFQNGRILDSLSGFAQKMLPKALKMLMDSLGQLSQAGKQL